MKEQLTESQIKYIHNKMCNKYRPWECSKCPLEKLEGCKLGIQIDIVKEWARKNVSEDAPKARREQ